jgi:3-dehydroquinate dehydratase / shikimate dehydrogenase
MSTLIPKPNGSRILPIRVPRVCVAVLGSEPAEMIEKAEDLVRENSFFEFRLDYLKDPAAGAAKVRNFMHMHPEVIAVATCRRVQNGGQFKGSVASQLAVLTKAASLGFQFVDVEIESAEAMKTAEYQKLHDSSGLILSFHDFKATRKLDETFERMKKFPADYYKVVSTATRLYDNVVMMKFLLDKSHSHSMVGMCMGEQGTISRMLGLRAGSCFTFAAATAGEETGPGQLAFRTLRDTYRIEQVDAATRVYGLAGDPVAKSLSPVMMNTAFRRENVNAVYLALHAKTLDDLIDCVREVPMSGLSVTMPYKEEIVEHLDGVDQITEQIGACNTVVRAQTGKLFGFNTDLPGVMTPLEQRLALKSAKVLVLGAGGGARAAAFGAKSRGAEVFILSRTPASGQKLAKQAKAKYINHADLKKYTFDVIINATPVGMNGDRSSPLSEKEIHARYLLDMVYTEPETPLVKIARSQGVHIIPGTEMFVAQGVRQFEIWTGKPAPVADMSFAVTTALGLRAASAGSANNGHKSAPAEVMQETEKAKESEKSAAAKPESKPVAKSVARPLKPSSPQTPARTTVKPAAKKAHAKAHPKSAVKSGSKRSPAKPAKSGRR